MYNNLQISSDIQTTTLAFKKEELLCCLCFCLCLCSPSIDFELVFNFDMKRENNFVYGNENPFPINWSCCQLNSHYNCCMYGICMFVCSLKQICNLNPFLLFPFVKTFYIHKNNKCVTVNIVHTSTYFTYDIMYAVSHVSRVSNWRAFLSFVCRGG